MYTSFEIRASSDAISVSCKRADIASLTPHRSSSVRVNTSATPRAANSAAIASAVTSPVGG